MLPCAWLQALGRDQVDGPIKEPFKMVFEIEIAVKGGWPVKLHQHIDITRRAKLIACSRAKERQTLGAVALHKYAPMRGQQRQNIRAIHGANCATCEAAAARRIVQVKRTVDARLSRRGLYVFAPVWTSGRRGAWRWLGVAVSRHAQPRRVPGRRLVAVCRRARGGDRGSGGLTAQPLRAAQLPYRYVPKKTPAPRARSAHTPPSSHKSAASNRASG